MEIKRSGTFLMFCFWSMIIFTYSSWVFFQGAVRFLPEMITSVREKYRRTRDNSGINTLRYKTGKELAAEEIEEEVILQKQRKKDPFNRGMSRYEDGLTWYYNIDDAFEVSRIQDKKILVVFMGSDWSIPCAKFKKQVIRTWRFRNLVNKNFTLVEIDVKKKYKEYYTKQAKGKKQDGIPDFFIKRASYIKRKIGKFDVKSLPTMIVFSIKGEEVLRIRGLGKVISTGWAAEYMDSLEKISTVR